MTSTPPASLPEPPPLLQGAALAQWTGVRDRLAARGPVAVRFPDEPIGTVIVATHAESEAMRQVPATGTVELSMWEYAYLQIESPGPVDLSSAPEWPSGAVVAVMGGPVDADGLAQLAQVGGLAGVELLTAGVPDALLVDFVEQLADLMSVAFLGPIGSSVRDAMLASRAASVSIDLTEVDADEVGEIMARLHEGRTMALHGVAGHHLRALQRPSGPGALLVQGNTLTSDDVLHLAAGICPPVQQVRLLPPTDDVLDDRTLVTLLHRHPDLSVNGRWLAPVAVRKMARRLGMDLTTT